MKGVRIGKFHWDGVDSLWFDDCWIKRGYSGTYGPRVHYDNWKRQGFELDFLAAAEFAYKNKRLPTELELEVKIVMLRLEGLT